MRQLFITLSCLLPPHLVASYNPVWEKSARFRLRESSSVTLVTGGIIEFVGGGSFSAALHPERNHAHSAETILVEENDLYPRRGTRGAGRIDRRGRAASELPRGRRRPRGFFR